MKLFFITLCTISAITTYGQVNLVHGSFLLEKKELLSSSTNRFVSHGHLASFGDKTEWKPLLEQIRVDSNPNTLIVKYVQQAYEQGTWVPAVSSSIIFVPSTATCRKAFIRSHIISCKEDSFEYKFSFTERFQDDTRPKESAFNFPIFPRRGSDIIIAMVPAYEDCTFSYDSVPAITCGGRSQTGPCAKPLVAGELLRCRSREELAEYFPGATMTDNYGGFSYSLPREATSKGPVLQQQPDCSGAFTDRAIIRLKDAMPHVVAGRKATSGQRETLLFRVQPSALQKKHTYVFLEGTVEP